MHIGMVRQARSESMRDSANCVRSIRACDTETTMSGLEVDVAAEFPGLAGGPYLDTAARGLLPRSAHTAITASLESLLMGAADKSAMFATVERARERFAGLVNARPADIAIHKNVSEGLNIIAAA